MKKFPPFIYLNLFSSFICITINNATGASYKTTEPAYFYVTKNIYDKDKKIFHYDFFYNGEKYLTLKGENLNSILFSKKDNKEDFYVEYNNKLLRYKNSTIIDDSINLNKDSRDNATFIIRSSHSGGVWIGADSNIYRTFLIFNIKLNCDEKNLNELKQKYNLNITIKECNKYKQNELSGTRSICVRQKYNKKQNSWSDEKVVLTHSESCLSKGCSELSYTNNSDKYEFINRNNFGNISYDKDEVLQNKLLNKFNIKFNYSSVLLNKTSDYIIAKCLKCNSFFDKKLFVLDKQLNTKTILQYDEPEHDIYFDFTIKKNKLFIRTNDKVYIYNLKNFKLINKIENIKFFSFI